MNHEGECAVARAAQRHGIPYALSTMGTTNIEEVAAAAPKARSGSSSICGVTARPGPISSSRQTGGLRGVDSDGRYVPVGGPRLRDTRNGFSIPPKVKAKTVLNAVVRPEWWFNLLTTEPLRFASLSSWNATIAELIDLLFDPTMTIDDLEWLRSSWDGPLVVKGIQNVEDAQRVVAAGADVVLVSNHGGRQLDRAPIPLRVLPDVVEAVGSQAEVWVDTGIMSGADVVAAIALGARIALVGRAYLYGLMAGGERGVDRAAEILSAEVRRTMQLLGVRSIDELGSQHVKLP